MFAVYDSFDYRGDTNMAMFMACMARGMLEITKTDLDKIIDLGRDAIVRDTGDGGNGDDDDGEEDKLSQAISSFPEPVGSA
jgi:hypothetical protein